MGPVTDSSGYGEAARNYIGALLSVGVRLSIEPVSFENSSPSLGKLGRLLVPHICKDLSYSINIIHLTPENYPKFVDPKKYNIGIVTWETSRLPDFWVSLINSLDQVWVPSKWNQEVFRSSGVTKPIYVVPCTLNKEYMGTDPNEVGRRLEQPRDPKTFIFYSIFQFLERKNPRGLLIAYLTEFTRDDNVCLIIKTYKQARYLDFVARDNLAIREELSSLKESLHLGKCPPVKLILEFLSREEVLGLHQLGDCFVLPSRGEGFSLGHAEAMALGKPVIGPRYGGNLEFMNDQNSYLVDCIETPVYGMPWSTYTGYQNWAEPSILSLRAKMREVYNNRVVATKIGKQGQEDIFSKFNWETIGNLMKARLSEVTL